jgi:hypothetical protein
LIGATAYARHRYCGEPITISTGGTYGGCHESTLAGTPAVSIATTAPVTISHMTVKHKGAGIWAQCTGGQCYRADLTVLDSTITATDPGTSVDQFSVYAFQPTKLVVEHNQITDGYGVTINGNNLTTGPFSISFNNYTNVGRYGGAGQFPGPVHTDKVLAPGGVVQWNRSTATYGSSLIEDAFGIYLTNGGTNNPFTLSHNLVNGAYPLTGDGASFNGGAFDLGDGGGSWLTGDSNYAVNYTNNAFMIPSGDHITHQNSKATYDGFAGFTTTDRVSSTFGDGATTWNNPAYPTTGVCAVTNVDVSHLRWSGAAWERSDYYLPDSTGCAYSGNDNLAAPTPALEQSLVNEFERSVTAASVIIGPRP